MAILLVVVVILALFAAACWSWRAYAQEVKQHPGLPTHSDVCDSFVIGAESAQTTPTAHHGDFGCVDPHHGGCDLGHGDFGGGHH